jgi:hypothetical protein
LPGGYGPSRRRAKWRWLAVGSIAATGLSLIACGALSWCLANLTEYNATCVPVALGPVMTKRTMKAITAAPTPPGLSFSMMWTIVDEECDVGYRIAAYIRSLFGYLRRCGANWLVGQASLGV